MSILTSIENRTENWKTARCFAPLFENPDLRLKLAKRLGEPSSTQREDVHLQLFWKGMRDHLHQMHQKRGKDTQDFTERYTRLFHDLRKDIREFRPEKGPELKLPKEWNYNVSTNKGKSKLSYNLERTEIDIVLETPNHLFIGEAKHETGFHANGRLVLVHQLVRQYVVASILVDRLESEKKVIPFVVGDKTENLMRSIQVQFMLEQCYLKKKNILTWDCIEKLTSGS